MKKIWLAVTVAVSLALMVGCSLKAAPAQENPAAPIRVAALKGPTAMGMVSMMDADQSSARNQYDFSVVTAIDEITADVMKGDLDIAAVPANLAAVLYQNGNGQIQVMAINTLGVLSVVENAENIHSIRDLKGRTVYATGKGATPELTLNYLLARNGLTAGEDVIVEFKSEPAECVAVLAEQENAIAMLPQPFATTAIMKNDKIRIALDLTEEWNNVNAESPLITGVVIGRTTFIEQNGEAVNEFLDRYKESVTVTNANIDEVSVLIEKYEIVPAAVAQRAVSHCNIVMIEGEDMKRQLTGYLAVLLEQKPESVGGSLPDDKFFYAR